MEKDIKMREILFRGKRVDNGEWVEGYYGIKGEKTDIEVHCIMVSNLYKMSSIPHFYFEDIDVIPKTVGQFTGLLDKNGTKIFEGDILESNINKKMLVIWRNDLASFALTADGWMYDHYFGEGADAGRCNIIGNIHDNHELI